MDLDHYSIVILQWELIFSCNHKKHMPSSTAADKGIQEREKLSLHVEEVSLLYQILQVIPCFTVRKISIELVFIERMLILFFGGREGSFLLSPE